METVSDEPTRTLEGRAPSTDVAGLGLEIVDGRRRDEPTPLAAGVTVIGRGDDVDLQLTAEGVSRRHVKLVVRHRAEVQLIDLGSHNGTYVNGVRVEVCLLQSGDEFRIGQITLRLVPHDPQGHAPTEPPSVDLSPRELEVARWVAQGMTNAQVGGRLHISPRTVGRHLANIYERLGIHSRAALASVIAAHDAGGVGGS